MKGKWHAAREPEPESTELREQFRAFVHDPQAALAKDLRRRFKQRTPRPCVLAESAELKELKHAA